MHNDSEGGAVISSLSVTDSSGEVQTLGPGKCPLHNDVTQNRFSTSTTKTMYAHSVFFLKQPEQLSWWLEQGK